MRDFSSAEPVVASHDAHVSDVSLPVNSTPNSAIAAMALNFNSPSPPVIPISDLAAVHEFQDELLLHEEDRPQEECGVFGIWAPGVDVARRAFFGIFALQHRGQESAGIAVSDGQKLQLHTDMGLVTQIFNEEILSSLQGDIAVAHNRYSTTGSSELCNAQPIMTNSSEGIMAVAHNGNLVNAAIVRREMEEAGEVFTTSMDTEVIGKTIEALNDRPLEEALLETMRRVQGAYSLVMMTRDTLIAMRDPNGVRPLCLGRLKDNSGWVVASETCALNVVNATFEREIAPGEICFINGEGIESVFYKEEAKDREDRPALCIFEFIYLARPDSQLMGRNVHQARRRMGETLARQSPVEAEVVIGVPDSGLPAAIGYAAGSGIPYQEGLIKNRYIARTFIQPDQMQRELGVRMKLTPLEDVLRGQRVVVVEDSIVRGTTTKRIVQMIRDAGATEVHLRISSPPYKWPCFYGIDTAARKDLIAYQRSVEEIRQYNGADSLAYITMDNLIEAVGHDKNQFCRACFDGEYPIHIPTDIRYTKLVLGEENGDSTNGHANGNGHYSEQSTLEVVQAMEAVQALEEGGPANHGGGDPGPESAGEWETVGDELVSTS
ncbi:MAG: amidophosphoribosyltransferase [Abditibacteriota bacterium]|nr:amidophosphoribosyltransferase [Abditibacteriota bacterium]